MITGQGSCHLPYGVPVVGLLTVLPQRQGWVDHGRHMGLFRAEFVWRLAYSACSVGHDVLEVGDLGTEAWRGGFPLRPPLMELLVASWSCLLSPY